jgi:hypothetical protein
LPIMTKELVLMEKTWNRWNQLIPLQLHSHNVILCYWNNEYSFSIEQVGPIVILVFKRYLI